MKTKPITTFQLKILNDQFMVELLKLKEWAHQISTFKNPSDVLNLQYQIYDVMYTVCTHSMYLISTGYIVTVILTDGASYTFETNRLTSKGKTMSELLAQLFTVEKIQFSNSFSIRRRVEQKIKNLYRGLTNGYLHWQ